MPKQSCRPKGALFEGIGQHQKVLLSSRLIVIVAGIGMMVSITLDERAGTKLP